MFKKALRTSKHVVMHLMNETGKKWHSEFALHHLKKNVHNPYLCVTLYIIQGNFAAAEYFSVVFVYCCCFHKSNFCMWLQACQEPLQQQTLIERKEPKSTTEKETKFKSTRTKFAFMLNGSEPLTVHRMKLRYIIYKVVMLVHSQIQKLETQIMFRKENTTGSEA